MGNCRDDEMGHVSSIGNAPQYYHDLEADGSLSTSILAALADKEGVDVTALDVRLHDHVDTDALDAIFAPRYDGTPRNAGKFTITVYGYSVTVSSDGHIAIAEQSDPM